MRDRRYSTAAWRRTRRRVILRAGGVCQIGGPRCTEIATTAHHVVPTSQGGAFFDLQNLQAACAPCNHHGAVTKFENRNYRQAIAYLERQLEQLEIENAQLRAELVAARAGAAESAPLTPVIY
jgi:5-methylcytosine-specific restriction endonuclease McrA